MTLDESVAFSGPPLSMSSAEPCLEVMDNTAVTWGPAGARGTLWELLLVIERADWALSCKNLTTLKSSEVRQSLRQYLYGWFQRCWMRHPSLQTHPTLGTKTPLLPHCLFSCKQRPRDSGMHAGPETHRGRPWEKVSFHLPNSPVINEVP